MSDNADPRWYVVMTHAHGERLAQEHLHRQGFRTYLPVIEKQRRHARKTETVARPLFPRYLFVALDQTWHCWQSIRSTVGVSHLVGNRNGPAAVPPHIVCELRGREDSNGYIRLEKRAPFAAGQRVQILDGAFSLFPALFEFMTDSDRIAVLLELMGRRVRVFVDEASVAAA
jgi:transcriptional antiterminator RfaH